MLGGHWGLRVVIGKCGDAVRDVGGDFLRRQRSGELSTAQTLKNENQLLHGGTIVMVRFFFDESFSVPHA